MRVFYSEVSLKLYSILIATSISYGNPTVALAENWKFSGKAVDDLVSDLAFPALDQEIYDNRYTYESDGEPVNWQNKDQEIDSPNLLDTNIDAYQRARSIINETKNNAGLIGGGKNPYETYDDISDMPEVANLWWDSKVLGSMGRETKPNSVSPESLIIRAMEHSSQIKVFSDVPVIRETAELEARGAFDPTLYFDYRLNDLDEPVGSTLKTGGPERFLEDEWVFETGIRKKFISGTEINLSQRWGVLDNNSEFLVPKDQANTRLAITLTQPLLNGAGVKYNRSLIDVAKLDGSIARDEFKRQVESHLLELVRSYWGLYLERAVLVQRRTLVERTQKIVETLEARSDFDVSSVQLQRARSELLTRKSNVVRAESAVRNAEARIVSLINDPDFRISDTLEVVPEQVPLTIKSTITQDMAITLALSKRPEINQALKQIQASAVRENMTKNELRPILNFVLGYYRDGLAGDEDYSQAYENQFDDGDGSWRAGLLFEIPLGNRVAKARHMRRQAETRQLSNKLRTTIDTVLLEVQVSVRELDTSYREMQAKYTAMNAINAEVDSLEDRQSVDFGTGINASAYLERLLDGQDRLSESEFEFVRSMVTYNIALANLDRATGMFMQTEEIQPRFYQDDDAYSDDLPSYKIERVNILPKQ